MKIKLSKNKDLNIFGFIKPDKFLNWFYFRINTTNTTKNFGFSLEIDLLKILHLSIYTEDTRDPHTFI